MMIGALLALALIALSPSANAMIDLERGDTAPDFSIRSVDGKIVDTTDARGEILVLLFGEIGQARSDEAYERVGNVLNDDQLDVGPVTWVYVLSKHSRVMPPKPLGRDAKHRPAIVHDADRQIFGAFQVVAMPCVVVIDPEGKVAHIIASLNPRFDQILRGSLRLASGSISAEQFDHMLENPIDDSDAEFQSRAKRLTRLGRYLDYQGMHEAAEEKYSEALAIVPDYAPARLALAELLRRTGRANDAEPIYRSVLAADPKSIPPSLGLAQLLISRGGEGNLIEAEQLLDRVEAIGGVPPRYHYLNGLLMEQRGKMDEAAAQYRIAAERLLEQVELEQALREGTVRE
jgi:tetratricopeptide (TPR) repeat protein